MDKFLKRKKDNDDDDDDDTRKVSKSDTTSVLSSSKITLVVLPGASGRISQTMENDILNKLKSNINIISKDTCNWNKYAAGHQSNINQIIEMIPSNKDYYLLGNSFGNRVICEYLSSNNNSNCLGVIMCGYPLYGDKNNEDRVLQLQKFPKNIKLMMISGSLDDFLNQNYLTMKGENLIRKHYTELSLSNDHSKLVIIENGIHDLPKTKGKGAKESTKAAAERIINEIKNFCI